MKKNLIIFFAAVLISCGKDELQIDFRDDFLGEYCCEETTFDFGNYTYGKCMIEVKKGEIDSGIVITINESASFAFVFDSDLTLRQSNSENDFYSDYGKFIGDSIELNIVYHKQSHKWYKGKKYNFEQPVYFEDSIKNIEGNTIKTVTIDGVTWMAENLRVTHDKKGNELPINSYEFISTGCGALYTLEIAETVCPDGWRLPSKEDWNNLFRTISIYPDCHFTNLIHPDFIELCDLNSKCYGGHPFETIESDISNAFWSSSFEEHNEIPFHVYFETYTNNYDSLYYRVLSEGLEESDKLFIRCIKDY